jgi:carbonic anhydrase
MDRRKFMLVGCPVCASAAWAQEAAPHWTYEGERGASKWGEVDSAFKACSIGGQQSPIDLAGAIPATVNRLSIQWKTLAPDLVNNGHTLQANVQEGSTLTIGQTVFDLKQFHFHAPSEHALNGKRSAMEAHFVHSAADGRLAVIGVLLAAGKRHPAFAELVRAAPRKEGEAKLRVPIDPHSFLPGTRDFYRYEGSLTTPPCSETVEWSVFDSMVEVAAADIETFKALYPMNARPLQAINRRFLLKGL